MNTLCINRKKVDFLNDNGSDLSMLTAEEFNGLTVKPPLKSTNKIGVGVFGHANL